MPRTLDELMRDARDIAFAILGLATEALDTGSPANRIQDLVANAAKLLEDAEANAVLAAGGDRTSLRAVEQTVSQLEEVRTQVAAERRTAEDS